MREARERGSGALDRCRQTFLYTSGVGVWIQIAGEDVRKRPSCGGKYIIEIGFGFLISPDKMEGFIASARPAFPPNKTELNNRNEKLENRNELLTPHQKKTKQYKSETKQKKTSLPPPIPLPLPPSDSNKNKNRKNLLSSPPSPSPPPSDQKS